MPDFAAFIPRSVPLTRKSPMETGGLVGSVVLTKERGWRGIDVCFGYEKKDNKG